MTRDEFDDFCGSLKATTHVIQWRGASVWKVGGKVFAIYPSLGDDQRAKFSFKCSDLSYRILIEQPGIIPAPYLARGQWVQTDAEGALDEDDLRGYIEDAYDIIKAKLTKAVRRELGV